MRPSSRSVPSRPRRKPPARSRLTRRAQPSAPLRRDRLKDALRTSREAVSDLERQLDTLLAALRSSGVPALDDVDDLRRATHRASAAVGKLR